MNMGLHTGRLLRSAYPVELLELHGIDPMPLAEMRRRNRVRGMQDSWLANKKVRQEKGKEPTKAKARKLKPERRKALILTICDVLRNGMPTPFGHEADCRTGLREAFCLQGWKWTEADAAAADIVATALRFLGAKRPSWVEGQPEHTQEGYAPVEHSRCIRCGGNMPDVTDMQNGFDRKYCSISCRVSQRTETARISGERHGLAQYWAALAVIGEQKRISRMRPCEKCGGDFIPADSGGSIRFCSRACAGNAKRFKACEACGTSYQVSAPGAGKRFCSKVCSNRVVAIKPKPCEWCSIEFTAKASRVRFCSTSCSAKWRCEQKVMGTMFRCEAAE